jgi:hypothetical protein
LTATAAPPACSSTAAPTRFTRSTGDWLRRLPPLFRLLPPLFFRDDEPLLADRVLFDLELLAERELDDFLPLLADRVLLAERAVGRFADEALRAPPRFALALRAVGRFDVERLRAPPFLLPPRRPLDPERFPRDDLALVAMVFCPRLRLVPGASAISVHHACNARAWSRRDARHVSYHTPRATHESA